MSRHVSQDVSLRRKKNEDDGDRHLAQKIAQNKRFSISNQADDEYDYDDGPSRKSKKKRGGNDQAGERNTAANRFSAKQEECLFCFESQKRPKHLVVAVANFTYLMLPQQEPVVPGHCCILPMQVSVILLSIPMLSLIHGGIMNKKRNSEAIVNPVFLPSEHFQVFVA